MIASTALGPNWSGEGCCHESGQGADADVCIFEFCAASLGTAILLANLISNYTGKVSAIAGHNRYGKPDPALLPPCPTRYLALPRLVPRLYDGLNWRIPGLAWHMLKSPDP